MPEVRSRRRTGSIWATPGGSPWATIDSAGARLLTGDPPHGAEPGRQRRARGLEDRPRRHRRQPATASTLKEAVPAPPGLGPVALRTAEAVPPAHLLQVGSARLSGREPALELSQGPGIILHGPGTLPVGATVVKGIPPFCKMLGRLSFLSHQG
jgi:hypothetical protein